MAWCRSMHTGSDHVSKTHVHQLCDDGPQRQCLDKVMPMQPGYALSAWQHGTGCILASTVMLLHGCGCSHTELQ